jgi:hypothetical protein
MATHDDDSSTGSEPEVHCISFINEYSTQTKAAALQANVLQSSKLRNKVCKLATLHTKLNCSSEGVIAGMTRIDAVMDLLKSWSCSFSFRAMSLVLAFQLAPTAICVSNLIRNCNNEWEDGYVHLAKCALKSMDELGTWGLMKSKASQIARKAYQAEVVVYHGLSVPFLEPIRDDKTIVADLLKLLGALELCRLTNAKL